MSSISIQQLKAFQAIMRTGSVSDAARELNRTQPAITASIRAMEEQLDLKLFTRGGNKVLPTAEARYLFDRSKTILEGLDETVNSLHQYRKQLRGELKIACLPAASQVLIPRLLASFLKTRPGVKLSFMTRTSNSIENSVASQQFDIGISETPTEPSELFYNTNIRFPCFLAIHRDSELASMDEVTVNALAKTPYIGLLQDHAITQALEKEIKKEGLELNQAVELQTIIPSFTFIEANMGFGVIDPLSKESYGLMNPDGPIVFKKLPFPLFYRLSILQPYFREKSMLCNVFAENLKKALFEIKQKSTEELGD